MAPPRGTDGWAGARAGASREQERRELAPAADRVGVHHAPSLEELQQLLARPVLVPVLVALAQLDQVVDGLAALAPCREAEREVEPRLMRIRIGFDLPLQSCEIAQRGGLLGELEGGADAS